MKSDFDECFDFVIGAEGGFSNDKRDSGGPTKFGISQKAYPHFTLEKIQNLKLSETKQIYFDDYWIKASCDKLWWPYNLAVFDCAVNCGVTFAKKLLQKALLVQTDGVIGEKTLKALTLNFGAFDEYSRLRRGYYKTLVDLNSKNKVFLKGWLNRVSNVEKFAKEKTK